MWHTCKSGAWQKGSEEGSMAEIWVTSCNNLSFKIFVIAKLKKKIEIWIIIQWQTDGRTESDANEPTVQYAQEGSKITFKTLGKDKILRHAAHIQVLMCNDYVQTNKGIPHILGQVGLAPSQHYLHGNTTVRDHSGGHPT